MTETEHTFSSTDVVRMLGITYRQLDNWTTHGFIPLTDSYTRPGSGQRRRWTKGDLELVAVFAAAAEVTTLSIAKAMTHAHRTHPQERSIAHSSQDGRAQIILDVAGVLADLDQVLDDRA